MDYPITRSVVPAYPSASYKLESGLPGSYGLGSGLPRSYGLGSAFSGSYGLGPESYYGLGSGSYGLGSGSYGSSGLISPSYTSGLYGSGSESCGQSEYGSLIASVIPTSLAGTVPHRGGVNIAQQIIHKPIITELQEVIHKPVITEVQEIVNKPIVSEVQQIIHKPLYTEHIGLGPSYHGYQKHIVKQPFYQKPTANLVHQPMTHTGTINLADEYDHAVTTTTTTHSVCPPELSYPYGLNRASFPTAMTYGQGIDTLQSGAMYGSAAMPTSQVASYGLGYPYGLSTGYSPIVPGSNPYGYMTVPSAQTFYRNAAPALTAYSNPTPISYSTQPLNEETSVLNNSNGVLYRNNEEKSQLKAAEQITYDELQPYKPQLNDNQYYDDQFQSQFSGFQQQQLLGRNNEEPKKIKIDVDAIASEIEKNPEMKKQLLKIITESMYVSEQITQTGRKQQDKII